MQTNAVYVFLMAIPAQPPKDSEYFEREIWIETREIVKDLDNISEWIEGELFNLHYHYFYSFNEVITKLAKLSEQNESVKIIPADKYSEAKLFIQIGNRRGYIYDTRSGFAFMLNQKIENPEEV